MLVIFWIKFYIFEGVCLRLKMGSYGLVKVWVRLVIKEWLTWLQSEWRASLSKLTGSWVLLPLSLVCHLADFFLTYLKWWVWRNPFYLFPKRIIILREALSLKYSRPFLSHYIKRWLISPNNKRQDCTIWNQNPEWSISDMTLNSHFTRA